MTDNEKEIMKTLNQIIHDQVVVMQAAWLEWQNGKGADAAMQWIENTLTGPGHLLFEDETFLENPQAYFDANRSDPFPFCWCGMPSNILKEGKGYCCEQHCAQQESIFIMPSIVKNEEPAA